MEEKRIILPIPHADISPNARVHWAKKAKLASQHRRCGYVLCATQHDSNKHEFSAYRLDFFWPDKRKRDKDNASARCKNYLDGIADYVGQDDSEWEFNGVRFMEPDKLNPRVEIVFEVKEK